MKLSNAFSTLHPELEPCMECKAVMVNINRGHNKSLKEQCSALREYAEFVARIRERTKAGTALGTAVEDVMDSCIRDGVLAEFLSIHRAEVFEVLLTEYDEQRHIADEKELSRREGKEEGRKEGRAEGTLEKAHELAPKLFAKDISAEEAGSICGEDSSLVAEWHREWEAAK